jgi:hypothetical protein
MYKNMTYQAPDKCKSKRLFILLVGVAILIILIGCQETAPTQSQLAPERPTQEASSSIQRTTRLALWLAKKDELIAHPQAQYNLVMTGWFEIPEAVAIKSRAPSAKLLAGLSHTWILDDPAWLALLLSVANGGDPNGPLQINEDMYLKFDDNGDGVLDRPCSLPGWDGLYAMDPRHPAWRRLILAFYKNVAVQTQHDGVIVDMLDAYPFCNGAWSGGVPEPLNPAAWTSAQDELLNLIRQTTPADKWVLANAGSQFPPGSPFPKYLNGYLLENFLGDWGANLETGLASARNALETTRPPHIVVFAVDTNDTGQIDWTRFRLGLAASLLMDNTYFAFDFGASDHGGVNDWWFPEYYNINLGAPNGLYSLVDGVYRRDYEKGTVIVTVERSIRVSFEVPLLDLFRGETGLEFNVPQGDGRIFLKSSSSPPASKP